MKRLIGLCLAICLCSVVKAQNIITQLQRDVIGQGTVTIHQDGNIAALLGDGLNASNSSQSSGQVLKKQGYRVQVYVGSNTRNSKNEANRWAQAVRNSFPEYKVYAMFNPPRWLCRVGDFRTIEEADAVMREMKRTRDFKEISIVRDQINITIE